jgi:D-glycero-alpha-D-manno-heptose-7-phosphate kinase
MVGLDEPLEITTIGDAPAGTGLGSSSSLTVGLLAAFYAKRGMVVSPERLASEACKIELEILGKPIGKQDQYAAAFGGLNLISFFSNGSVNIEPVPCSEDTWHALQSHMLLVYTNVTRAADEILERQSTATSQHLGTLKQMSGLAEEMRIVLANGDLQEFGRALHTGWELKRSLGCGISNTGVDRWYELAREHGVWGGKLLGAGGGGFLLLLAAPGDHPRILRALGHPKCLPCKLIRHGSRLVFINES